MAKKTVKNDKRKIKAPRNYTKAEIEAEMGKKGLVPSKK